MGLLGWALVAFIVAIVAAVFGFGRIAAGAAAIGRLLFGLFIIVAVVLLILNFLG